MPKAHLPAAGAPQATPPRSAIRSLPAPPQPANPFGAPPLIAGEDAAAYDELLARVIQTVAPADFLEEMWVRDVVDLGWEAFRLRRLKAQLMTATADEGLEKLLARTLPWHVANDLSRRWAARERSAIREADTLLRRTGLTMEAVTARTLAVRIDDVERIDHMIMLAERRRNAILREVGYHRAGFAQVLRRAGDIEDAEFEEVAPLSDVPCTDAPQWDKREPG